MGTETLTGGAAGGQAAAADGAHLTRPCAGERAALGSRHALASPWLRSHALARSLASEWRACLPCSRACGFSPSRARSRALAPSHACTCVCVRARACVCACARACLRACVPARRPRVCVPLCRACSSATTWAS
jgi:hypothetical protein